MRSLMIITMAMLIFSLVSCTEQDYLEVKVNDNIYQEGLEKELRKLGVTYEVYENTIRYREKDSAKFAAAISALNSDYPALFTIFDDEIRAKFKTRLDANNISYELKKSSEGGVMFIVDSQYRNDASLLLDEIHSDGDRPLLGD